MKIKRLKRSAVAEMAGVTPRTVARWEASGQLTPIKLNSRLVVYNESQVVRLLNGQVSTTAPADVPPVLERDANGGFRARRVASTLP